MVDMDYDYKTHAERVRETGDAYLKITDDYSRVVLAYAHALHKARQAVGGDDTAFGKWIAKHSLDTVNRHDRAAPINTGKHAKIAATVLRRTSSHSPRLIWKTRSR
jgi:hypothetical protein